MLAELVQLPGGKTGTTGSRTSPIGGDLSMRHCPLFTELPLSGSIEMQKLSVDSYAKRNGLGLCL